MLYVYPFDREILLVGIYPAEMQAHATKDGKETFRAVFICKKKEKGRGAGRKGEGRLNCTARKCLATGNRLRVITQGDYTLKRKRALARVLSS